MSPPTGRETRLRQGFPRVSGDEPAPTLSPPPVLRFSPRERG